MVFMQSLWYQNETKLPKTTLNYQLAVLSQYCSTQLLDCRVFQDLLLDKCKVFKEFYL